MVLKKVYDESTKTQRVWYDSSQIVYSEMKENEFENIGDLYITFKNGATYVYKDVSFSDYIIFLGGGNEGSHGKALNKVIKGKYQVEKVGTRNIDELFKELNNSNSTEKTPEEIIAERTRTFYVFGHRDLEKFEFEGAYLPLLNKTTSINDVHYVMANSDKAGRWAQDYLIDIVGINPNSITVYCLKGEQPDTHVGITNVKNSFESKDAMEGALTRDSGNDIAFVRDITTITNTAQNLLRRHKLQL